MSIKITEPPAFLPDALCARLRVYSDRDSWLSARQARIAAGSVGSTTAGALLGLSPWRSRWDVWAAVHAPNELQESDSDPRMLARGLALESLCDQLYAQRFEAKTWGVAEYMTVAHPGGVLVSSPDAFAFEDGNAGVAEYKVIAPWNRDYWPDADLEIRTLGDLDAASQNGRWPVARQYVVQAMMHLLCTDLDFCDLFAIFAKDVELGYQVDGWDSHVAVDGTCCLRIWRDAATLDAVQRTILQAHKEIILDNNEPTESRPPAMWDAARDPLTGKREATPAERETLAEIAQITAKNKAGKTRLDHLRADLRDRIADSDVKAIYAESTAGKISASIAKSGRFTIRGL